MCGRSLTFLITAALALPGLSSTNASGQPGAAAGPGSHFVGYTDSADSDAPDEVDNYDVFYDRLSSDGEWFYDDNYGYVFQPQVAADSSDWRPYADGHWVWTDRGWFWSSDEDFGWACYHYGGWIRFAGAGWVWVPGSDWAPAWVSWRQSDDYAGWAPLPPESSVGITDSFHVSDWSDSYFGVGPAAYVFIRWGDWFRPSYHGYFAPPDRNIVFFNETRNITNVHYENNVINNFGPEVASIERRTGQQVPRYNVNFMAQRDPKAPFKTTREGNQLHVSAPAARLRNVASIRPQARRQLGAAQVERGWQNVPEAQRAQMRQQLANAHPVPQGLPPKPAPFVKHQFIAARPGGANQPAHPPGAKPGPPGPVAEKARSQQGHPPPPTQQPAGAAAAEQTARHQAQHPQGRPHPQAAAHPQGPPDPQAAPHRQDPPHPQAAAHPQGPPHPQAAAHPHPQGGKGKGNEKKHGE